MRKYVGVRFVTSNIKYTANELATNDRTISRERSKETNELKLEENLFFHLKFNFYRNMHIILIIFLINIILLLLLLFTKIIYVIT